ncbi:MAG: amidohydrolase family protein [Salinimicrobium sp.]
MKKIYFSLLLLFFSFNLFAQSLLKPARVFDGKELHENWIVIVEQNRITYAGPGEGAGVPKNAEIIELPGQTLMPGLIEGHSHLLLHPYDETSWNDQVLKESPAERAIRGSVHARKSLMAGVTFMRDLGSEGAGYTDVYLEKSIEEGIIPGPRLQVAGPAIVATGAYGPKGFHSGVQVPLGAEEASGKEEVMKTVRRQIGNGADIVKVYADYRWGSGEPSMPTFSEEELKAIVETAHSAGRNVVAHASTPEGITRAVNAGVYTIEHGDNGTPEVFKLMKQKNVALCPTLAAGDAMEQYRGWKKGSQPDPERIVMKKATFKQALQAGVPIVFGGDVGVFTHGENYRELELMVAYGMNAIAALRTATSGNAELLQLKDLGNIKAGYLADIISVEGNPVEDISAMRKVDFVMKDGKIYKQANEQK